MNLNNYALDPLAKSCKVASIFDDSSLNNVFMEGVPISIRHSLHNYWETNSMKIHEAHSVLVGIAFTVAEKIGKNQRSKNPSIKPAKPSNSDNNINQFSYDSAKSLIYHLQAVRRR